MKVALIQMKVTAGDVEGNRERAFRLVEKAADKEKAEVIILPEIWTTGYALRDIESWAEDVTGPTIFGLSYISRKYSVHIITGSIPVRRDGQIFNGASVIAPNGEIIDEYQKIHLFSMMKEERFFTPGARRSVFSINGVKAGLAICYDLRFPELFRSLAIEGAEVIFVPAEWPATRGEHWRLLNQTRALENQVFICAINCSGEHKGQPFYGHSMVVAPTGEVLAEGDSEEAIICCELDVSLVGKTRQAMSVWQDRRPELYL